MSETVAFVSLDRRAREEVLFGDGLELTAMLHLAYAELGDLGLNFTAVDQDITTTVRRAQAGSSWCWLNAAPSSPR
ncbi:hypothetical protein ABZ345_44465 [Lentzea sp. NPDC005914]|uniref:hypothetical protein n=1 Tax=Lentzea sp. NPDC005914 TaxID=3154572 RepID=UPI0033F9A427